MRKIIFLLLSMPLSALSQNGTEYLVFENALLEPNPGQIDQFEQGVASHNQKYHGEGPYGVRVYWVNNGPDTGNYVWTMGPFPWSSVDNRPAQKDGHEADWNTKIAPYLASGSGDQSYWKFNPEVSRFPKDINLKNLLVDYYDVKRGKMADAMKLIEKINKVYADKLPDETYGIYTNEFPSTKEGRDLVVISFFDKSAWLSQDTEFVKKFDEVHGKGGWDQFLIDWYAVTDGGESEIWNYRPELSGLGATVKAAERK